MSKVSNNLTTAGQKISLLIFVKKFRYKSSSKNYKTPGHVTLTTPFSTIYNSTFNGWDEKFFRKEEQEDNFLCGFVARIT